LTIEADRGIAALTLLERADRCDLVIMDDVMPGLSGQEMARIARRARPELKILFLNAYAAHEGVADPRLKKPFKTPTLAEAISNALQ
jgi:CheY-like chemotaxis protein